MTPLAASPYLGRVTRTSSTAASTSDSAPPSVATNTIRIVSPAHGVSETDAEAHAARSVFAAPDSDLTSVRVPSDSSTNAWNVSAELAFEACAR